jgi:hypothetical protein
MMIDGKPRLACQTFVRDLLAGPVHVAALAQRWRSCIATTPTRATAGATSGWK